MKKLVAIIATVLVIGFCIGALLYNLKNEKDNNEAKCEEKKCELNNSEDVFFNKKIREFVSDGKYLCVTDGEEMGFDYLTNCVLLRNGTLFALDGNSFKELTNKVSDLYLLNYGNSGMKMFFYINNDGKLFYMNNETTGKAYQSFELLPEENVITMYNSLSEDSHLINAVVKTKDVLKSINIDEELDKIIDAVYNQNN